MCAYQIEEVPFACIFSEVSHLISVQVLKKVVQCSLITVNFTDRLQTKRHCPISRGNFSRVTQGFLDMIRLYVIVPAKK